MEYKIGCIYILIFEFMIRSKVNHRRKPGSTGCSFNYGIGLLRNVNLRSHTQHSNPGP